MSKAIHNVTLNVLDPGWPPEIDLTELDSGHQIRFYIAGMDLTDCTAKIWIEKPSGLRVWNECTISGNCVTADITNQMLAERGRALGQIKLESTDGRVTPCDFIFNVRRDISGDGLESKNESTVLENMIKDIIAENLAIEINVDDAGNATLAIVPASAVSEESEVAAE